MIGILAVLLCLTGPSAWAQTGRTAWDGHREILTTPARLSFGNTGRTSVGDPTAYTRSPNGESLLVYKRVNGSKVQLVTISSRNDGTGMVSEYGHE